MQCIKCDTEMKNASVVDGFYVNPIFISYKENGFLKEEKRSELNCFVCPKCGYVELRAKTPAVFLDSIY